MRQIVFTHRDNIAHTHTEITYIHRENSLQALLVVGIDRLDDGRIGAVALPPQQVCIFGHEHLLHPVQVVLYEHRPMKPSITHPSTW